MDEDQLLADKITENYQVDQPLDEYGDPIQVSEEPAPEPEVTPEPEPTPEPEVEPEPEPEPEPVKKEQSPEENAKFAEERRQKQLDERLKQEREKWEKDSTESKITQFLAKQYGMTPDKLFEQLQEAQLQKEAQERNVPVELLKERQEFMNKTQQLEQELNKMRFENWRNRIEGEKSTLAKEYPMLNADDMDQAVQFMLGTLRNPEVPLSQAVMAIHGSKIVQSLQEAAKNEALAEISGRAKSPLPPQGGKPAPTVNLTEEEKFVAQLMGVTEEDYLKYKS